MKKVNPLDDKILVKIIEDKKESPTGIILPETSNEEKPMLGEVVAIGNSDVINIKIGDKVLFTKFSGSEISVNQENHLILSMSDILATVEI